MSDSVQVVFDCRSGVGGVEACLFLLGVAIAAAGLLGVFAEVGRIMALCWELWRCQLCKHGREHCRQDADCAFAHRLCELQAPDEQCKLFLHYWQWGVDRFYGQRYGRRQAERFRVYYMAECEQDWVSIPSWAHGLWALLQNVEQDRAYCLPWDFGLQADWEAVRRYRCGEVGRTPFVCYPMLWQRLRQRRAKMLQYASSIPGALFMLPTAPLAELRFLVSDAGKQTTAAELPAPCSFPPPVDSGGPAEDVVPSTRLSMLPYRHYDLSQSADMGALSFRTASPVKGSGSEAGAEFIEDVCWC